MRDKHGVNLLDTADVYNQGAAELALVEVLRDLPRLLVRQRLAALGSRDDGKRDRRGLAGHLEGHGSGGLAGLGRRP